MKPLFVLARIVFVGCLWSVIFIEGVRVIMLQNWHFDIFWPEHWAYVWKLWSLGWVIDTPKEWAFILLLGGFGPLWLTGWIALSLVPWDKWLEKAARYPLNLYRKIANPIKVATKTPVVVKKKSYKEIRPKGTRAPIYDYSETTANAPKTALKAPAKPAPTVSPAPSVPSYAAPSGLKEKVVNARETFSHSLFDMDDGEDEDFDLDFESLGKPDKAQERNSTELMKNIFADEEPASVPVPAPASGRRETFDFDLDETDDDDDFIMSPARVPARNNRENNRRGDNRADNRSRENRYNNPNNTQNNRNPDRQRNVPRANNNQPQRAQAPSVPQRSNNPVADILVQKGYDILAGQIIRNTIIDFIGVSGNKILLCLIDKEAGDWLADEERFNNEEPLWFSESSHRISPVRKVGLAKQSLLEKLEENGLNYDVVPYVIIQIGSIINAEDMFEVWRELGVEVTRINRGAPKEIKLFSKSVEEAENRANKQGLDVIRKLIRNVA